MHSSIANHVVPKKSISLWWLGQSGFVIKSPRGSTVLLDPYLSNSCRPLGEQAGFKFDRLVPPPFTPADLAGADLYLLTHTHQDHLDPETVQPYHEAHPTGRYLAPPEAAAKLEALGIPRNQIEVTWPNKAIAVGDLTLHTAFAIPFGPDDLTHVGYILKVEGGPVVYFTGDTAYHEILALGAAPHRPDVLVAVINGAFRNLGPAEAARLAKELDVRVAIPCHHDLFMDNCQPPQMLRTNLKILGLADRYRLLSCGQCYTYPAN
jgi:L-ascorbate 6-phosphate lactonase